MLGQDQCSELEYTSSREGVWQAHRSIRLHFKAQHIRSQSIVSRNTGETRWGSMANYYSSQSSGGVNLKDKMACSLGMNGDNYNIHCSCLDLAITTSANIQKPDCHLSAIQRLLSVVSGGITGAVTPTTYYHDTISAYCFQIVGCTKTIDLLIPDFQIHLHVPRTRAITSNRSAKIYLQFRRLGVYRFNLLWTEHQL